LIKVPPDGALAELERVDPVTAQSLRHAAEIGLEAAARQVLWHFGETQELSLQVFEAFRVAVAKEGK
jgi:hypothetical protein